MKSIRIKILMLALLFFLRFGYADSSVYAQNESQSPIHEIPEPDHCSVITFNIRQLAFSLKETVKEESLLESPVHPPSENKEYYEQQMNEYEQRMALLQARVSSLRKQIDTKEDELENCLKNIITPLNQKDLQATQKKGEP